MLMIMQWHSGRMKRLMIAISALYITVLLTNIVLASRLHSSSLPTNQEFPRTIEIRKSPQPGRLSERSNSATTDAGYTITGLNSNIAITLHDSGQYLNIAPSEIWQSPSESIPSQRSKTTNASDYKVAGLDCASYGGPVDASKMVFWRDVPQDDKYVSPYYHDGGESEKYITFEPDKGGFNNIRMALETVVSMAVAMGRPLVIPPSQAMYLLDGGNVSVCSLNFLDYQHVN